MVKAATTLEDKPCPVQGAQRSTNPTILASRSPGAGREKNEASMLLLDARMPLVV